MPTCEEKLTAAWKKRLEEYELPELTDGRRKILEKLIPENYQKDVLG